MKAIFSIIKRGLQNPRFYLEALSVKWQSYFFFSLLMALLLSINTIRVALPILEDLQTNIETSVKFVPGYETKNNELVLNEGQKPLYYQSEYFQLVVDDTLTNLDQTGGLSLPKEALNRIDSKPWVNLFVMKNQAMLFVKNAQYSQAIPLESIGSDKLLKENLLSLGSIQGVFYAILFLTAFLAAWLIYGYIILVNAIIIGLLNVRLTVPLPFSGRVKLSILISAVPILMIEIIQWMRYDWSIPYYMVFFVSFLIAYFAFKNHTQFMQELLQHINQIQDQNEQEGLHTSESNGNKEPSIKSILKTLEEEIKRKSSQEDSNDQDQD